MMHKTHRILKIYKRLRQGPLTIEALHQWTSKNEIDISLRSLYRDLKEIESAHLFPNEKVVMVMGEKNRKIWKIEFEANTQALTPYEVNSFYLFKNMASACLRVRQDFLASQEERLYQSSSQSNFETISPLSETHIASTHFYETSYTKLQHQHLEDFIWAIQHQRKLLVGGIQFNYTCVDLQQPMPIKILPLQILYHRGGLHVAALEDSSRQLIILAIEQIKNMELLNEMFAAKKCLPKLTQQIQRRFGITENINQDLHHIEIEFTAHTGQFVAKHFWHHSQQFIQRPNGNYLLQLHCGINRELIGWLFQWMDNVRVLHPPILKAMVQDKLTETLDQYAEKAQFKPSNSFLPK